ncbi:dienelactone hydrolase family protein [Frankia sp. AiPs1]|uniref:alpha/beta hydrolase family protein n=1 Tax=Frankia sp. AiPs1 TaxID=573493 RepID=UPI0020446CF3|nr:dienelactone hydrolase family protein [Frankia sp. AiPs1]MCM3924077.1 dienelactone hydrolase family protein [Frankia sp. AiPs1]
MRRTVAPSMRRPAALAVVPLALLVLLGCVVGSAAPAHAGGGPSGGGGGSLTGAAAAAPADAVSDPDLPGPWQIGYRTVQITDSSRPGRVLVTSLWYPARPNGSATPGSALPAVAGVAGVHGPSGGPRATVESDAGGACPEVAAAGPADLGGPGQPAFYPLVGDVGLPSASAVTDAAPAPGPFPLVVFSHGSFGSRTQSAFLMEALAGHGFLVAAPDHPGDTMTDAAAGREERQVDLATDRPRDVSAVIDALTARSCPDAARIRPDQIGVVGFSFGGFTAVVSSIATLPVPADVRIRASVGLAATTSVLPAASLAEVHVPTLLIGGTQDGTVPIPENNDRAFNLLVDSHPRMTVAVTGATHNSWTEICRQAGLLGAAGIPAPLGMQIALTSAATCWPPQLAPADAHRLADHYIVAFLALHLRGQSGYARYLTSPDAEDAPLATVRSSP